MMEMFAMISRGVRIKNHFIRHLLLHLSKIVFKIAGNQKIPGTKARFKRLVLNSKNSKASPIMKLRPSSTNNLKERMLAEPHILEAKTS